MTTSVVLKPIDGWGFVEKINGLLAPRFQAEILEAAVEFGPKVVGWKAKALDGKYSGAQIQITPRHKPWSGLVSIKVNDAADNRLLFSGIAESKGLRVSWEQGQ